MLLAGPHVVERGNDSAHGEAAQIDSPPPPTASAGMFSSPEPAVAAPAGGGSTGAPVPDPAWNSHPLPPFDTPVEEIYDELASRARSGDARAACRLAAELERCQWLEFERTQRAVREHFPRQAEQTVSEAGSTEEAEAVIESWARAIEHSETIERACGNLAPSRNLESFDWLLMAVDMGHAASIRRFVRRPAIPAGSYLSMLDRLAVYRDRAPALALAALEGGDLEMLSVVAEAYRFQRSRGNGVAFGDLLPRDPIRANAMQILEKRLHPRDLIAWGDGWPRKALDPEDAVRAEGLADELEARWFPDVPHVPAPVPKRAGPPWPSPGDYAAHCNRDD